MQLQIFYVKLYINDAKTVASPPTDPDIDKYLTVTRVIVVLTLE